MSPLDVLHTRNSAAVLMEPAPCGDALYNILKAAVRASDHRRLRPWKFLLVEGESREKLSEIFLGVATSRGKVTSTEAGDAIKAKLYRAPLIIVVVASIKPDTAVPEIEQILSAGCAAQLMLVAAHAQGYAGIWRTGDMAYDPEVVSALGLTDTDKIVGFIYLGTASKTKPLAIVDPYEHTTVWNG